MRVAFILPSLRNSAPINVALAIAQKLIIKGHLVDIFYLRNDVELNFIPAINYKYISFFSRFNWSNYDIVHSHMLRPDLFIFIRKPIFLKTKVITTIHNYVYPELTSYYNILTSYLFGTIWLILWTRFDLLVTLSKHSLNYYKNISINKKLDYGTFICWLICFNYFNDFIRAIYITDYEIDWLRKEKVVTAVFCKETRS
jgi:glycosyltransferase involved in cell wall biosynthesis